MVHFVNHRTARHEEHALGHGVVEQVEERCTKGHDDDAMCFVIVVPVKGVCQVERCAQAGEDVGELGHR